MLTIALTIFAIRLKGGMYGFLLGLLFAGLLRAPVPVLLGLAALPISPELALAAILLEVTAESTPPGNWNVRQLGGAELSGGPRRRRPLGASPSRDDVQPQLGAFSGPGDDRYVAGRPATSRLTRVVVRTRVLSVPEFT